MYTLTQKLEKSRQARATLQKQVWALAAQVVKLLHEPRPMKGVLRVVSRDDPLASLEADDDAPILHADGTPDVEATTMKLMKAARSRPILSK